MEIGRGRRLALAGAAAFAGGVHAACLLDPGERKLDFRVSGDGRKVEILRQRVPDSVPPICVLELACKVRAKPNNMSYALRAGSLIPGDIAAVEFYFPDGSKQGCRVIETKTP